MLSTLISTLLLALLYLAIVRFVDMNEKEPLWAMLLLFFLGAAGAAVVTLVASKTLLAPAQALDGAGVERLPAGAAFASTLGLTLTNPPTILAFAAIFAGLGLAASATWASAALVVLGVFLGSASWWIALPLAASRLRGRIGPRTLRGINLVSGVSILGFAAWQLARLVR